MLARNAAEQWRLQSRCGRPDSEPFIPNVGATLLLAEPYTDGVEMDLRI